MTTDSRAHKLVSILDAYCMSAWATVFPHRERSENVIEVWMENSVYTLT